MFMFMKEKTRNKRKRFQQAPHRRIVVVIVKKKGNPLLEVKTSEPVTREVWYTC